MCYMLHLDVLFNTIIGLYFNKSICAFIITQQIGVNYHGNFPIVNIKLLENNDFNIQHLLKFGCQDIIIQVDNPETVITNIEFEIKMNTQRFNNRRYLILPTRHSSIQALERLLLHEVLHFVPNFLVIVPQNENNIFFEGCNTVFKLITHKFVGLSNNDEVVTLDFWYAKNRSFEWNNNLYPNKLLNLQYRTLRLTTFNYKPYSVVDGNNIDGTEMRVILEYAKRCNATINFVLNEEDEWGNIYNNWTGNGVLGDLVVDNADLGLGALYSWYLAYEFLDFSMPVVRTGITCLAPAPLQQHGLLVPFYPFQPLVWITVLTSFLFLLILYYHLFCNRNNRMNFSKIFLTIVRIFLLQSLPSLQIFDRAIIRCLLFFTLIYSLLLSINYNSGLASNMTVPRYNKAIHSVQDLAHSKLAWGATHAAWIFSLQSITQPTIVEIVNKFQLQTEEQLQGRITTRDFAFPIERLPFGHYAISDFMTEKDMPYLMIMSEDIYWEYSVVMTRKSSPFIPELSQLILRIHESGLPYIWETFVAMQYLDNKVQMAVHILAAERHFEHQPIELNISHIAGALVIWAGGNFISVVVFIIEYKKYMHK